MNIHEYQAKELLSRYGVSVPRGKVVFTPKEAGEVATELLAEKPLCVVKAQIHAGGRGKAGGVKLARSREEAEALARELLGKVLVTYQTGPEGREVKKVLIEEGLDIEKEYYMSLLVDRARKRVCLMASSEGGMDIEEVARKSPEKILYEYIDPAVGLMPFQARRVAFGLGLRKELTGKAVRFMLSLYEAFLGLDASLVEINPFVTTADGNVIALDAKLSFDDNALFRHRDVEALRDLDEEDPREVAAARFNLNYVSLDGTIGCMVNGAGLAMATMDIIKLYGGSPANFLDVGGGASTEQITAAYKLLVSDENVKAILINIFGGIMRCDVIAEGIVKAVKDVGETVPIVVRLQGTNVEEGRRMFSESGMDIITAETMDEAAQKVVSAAGG